ncbi:M56 family metallopeptidase [Floccifex porci]|uniref:Peptidase M56 domain-containing protein n=1 Tax=Floccifex porci TaxID=2606629 RepID=A0A7X2T306_9FIRM|nr:M56 family metallopeptidase [Floccifex porci]MSS00932.1 hypothetical protein [Floccifex porci]
MILSFSSIFITLVVSTLLILFSEYIFIHKQKFYFFRVDFLIILMAVIFIRLLLPFEYPSFTITIELHQLMNPINDFFLHEYFSIPFYKIFIFVWITVAILLIGKYIYDIYKENKRIQQLELLCIHKNVSDFFDVKKNEDYKVWIMDYTGSPMVIGSKKIIFLPENIIEMDQIEDIIRHEMSHINSKDFYMNVFVQLITKIYWWFLPVYLLKKQMKLLLEVRADTKAVKEKNGKELYQYSLALIQIEKLIKENEELKFENKGNTLILENKETLKYRIHYLINSKFNKKSNIVLILSIVLLPFLSNCIIFEASYEAPEEDGPYVEISDIENGYIVHHKDGTYTLHMNDMEVSISSISEPPFSELPVIVE